MTPTPRSGSDTTRPLKILQVSARYHPYVGGTEIHTGQVAAGLRARGHDVTVLTTDLGGDLPANDTIDGVPVRRVRAWPKGFDLYVAPGLAEVIGSERWDLVHVQGYHTAVAPLALRAAQRRGIPTALTFHSGGHSASWRNLLRPLHTRAMAHRLRRCALLVGVSEFENELFTQRLGLEPGHIVTIPNGVSTRGSSPTAGHEGDDPTPAPAPTGDDSPGGGPHLLSIGRLQRYKGHQRIIRAMPRLLRVDPRTRLTIIGTGPYQPRLERLVRRLDIGHAVVFDSVGPDDRHRLDEIMATASAAVFLSEYESFGMAAHEALLAGLPVVVLDATALGRLAAEGLARAVPPRATDHEVASIVLRTLNTTDGGAPGDQRPELDRLRHAWPTIVRRLEAAYHRALPTGNRTTPTIVDQVG